ncbi:MAG TPA: CoA transferase [Candidatus Binataceae bacterium]|nr:CoA transferase [Candidatus Binataceae bacterium]
MAGEGIFSGMRVVEFSQWVAGPMMAKMMADLGAEVIKLELPPGGDHLRASPQSRAGFNAGFISENRGKKSVCLDVKKPEGAAIARALIAHADVFLENFTPGVVAKYGLRYEELRPLNPRLIMCSISGYGQQGPYAHKAGNDLVAQAASGLSNNIGYPDGSPLYPSITLGDCTGGVNAFAAVTAALFHRERTGLGQYVDISLVECLAYYNSLGMVNHSLTHGAARQTRTGAHSPALAPFGMFKATGGYVAISVLHYQWEIFCNAIGRPELATDPRFDTVPGRMKNQAAVIEVVETWLQSFPSRAEPLAILEAAHILSAPVAETHEVIESPQTRFRGSMQEVEHPGIGPVGIPKTPFRFSATTVEIPGPAPLLGQHNQAVLCGLLGFADDKIAALTEAGILAQDPLVAQLRATGVID